MRMFRRLLQIVMPYLILLTVSICSVLAATTKSSAAAPPPCITSPTPDASMTPVPTQSGPIFINEIMTNPSRSWDCMQPATKSPWVELYNPQNQTLDLYASHAILAYTPSTDSYALPQGSQITAHGFAVIFLTSAPYTGGPIRLSLNGEIADLITPPSLMIDQSYARIQDGAANWQTVDQPTIGASNSPPLSPPAPTATPPRITPTSKSTRTSLPTPTATHEPAAQGTQPAWNVLQASSSPPATPALDESLPLASQPTNAVADAEDGRAQKIWLSTLIGSLIGVALLCKHLLARRQPDEQVSDTS